MSKRCKKVLSSVKGLSRTYRTFVVSIHPFLEIAYSDDNLCRTRFTQGQVDRMKAQFELYRYKKPVATPTLPPVPTTLPPTPPPELPQPLGEQSFSARDIPQG
jgi:hypothetical protein